MAEGNLSFSIVTDAFDASLKKFLQVTDFAAKVALMRVAYEILRLSQLEVPHDKGTLQNSGNVQEINNEIIVGYHSPYAARLHEHPEYRFQKGRKGKYLSDPIVRNTTILGLKFTAEMDKGVQHG